MTAFDEDFRIADTFAYLILVSRTPSLYMYPAF